MTSQQLIALAVAALLVFWMVGAYNRLVSLRNAIGLAWAKVDEALRQRALAATPLLAAMREPLAAEQGAIDAVQAALTESTRGAAAMQAKTVDESHASAFVTAETSLAAARSRLFALLEQNHQLRSEPAASAGAAGWRDAEARLVFARQVFNEAVDAYNGALTIFPTRLLLPMFRFGRAGRI